MTPAQVEAWLRSLREDGRSRATLEKYRRDVMGFFLFLPAGKAVDKGAVQSFKEHLLQGYRVSSVNSILTASTASSASWATSAGCAPSKPSATSSAPRRRSICVCWRRRSGRATSG